MSKLRALRIAAGMTQEQLAAAADLAQPTISQVERGRGDFSSHAARRVAQALAGPLNRPARDIAGELVMATDAGALQDSGPESFSEVAGAA